MTPKHLGGIIVAEKGRPVQITFQNNLPNAHILPVDTTIMGAEGSQNRTSIHLHGGEVPWISDGNPFAWWDAQGGKGENFVNNQNLNPTAADNEAEYYYPNNQSARMMWYHDHAVGITRLNAHAGIATAYIIRDNFERNLVKLGLPNFIELGGRELPIVIQDKTFLQADDPAYPGAAKTAGSLFYPYTYDPAMFAVGPNADPNLLPPVSAVPETFGDTMLVNGTVWPVATVAPRRYRLRILNACQAMFLNLQLYEADANGNPMLRRPGPDVIAIGTEGGFLARPFAIQMGKAFNPLTMRGSLMTAPGERWDVVIDFNGLAGRKFVLVNDAPAPFPMGAPPVGDAAVLMRIDVGPEKTAGPADKPLRLPANLAGAAASGIPAPLAVIGTKKNWFQVTTEPIAPPAGVTLRALTLNEGFDNYGRLIQRLGTNVPVAVDPATGLSDFARSYVPDPMMPSPNDAPTEVAADGAVEVWQIYNLTADAHPMHFHLANVQILSRQAFDLAAYQATPVGTPAVPLLLGRQRGPDESEIGWKETVKMYPGEVTTVIMKLALPVVPFDVPASPRTGGNEYVWHCHILEHEEHDMMRPLVVTGVNPVR